MNIKQAKDVVKYIMSLNFTPVLVGEAGVGKTDMIRQIAKETGRELIVLMLSQMEPGDLLGLPVANKETGKTEYMAPDWFPSHGNVIIFLDEINRSHNSVRAAVMQLLLDRRIHNHVLPEGAWVAAAMNPEDFENYDVEPIIDRAFLDRFVWIGITNDAESWFEYELKQDPKDIELCATIKEFLNTNPDVAIGTTMPKLPELSVTFRALDRFRIVYENCPTELEPYLPEIATGILGNAGVKILQMHKEKLRSSLTYKHLLEGDIEKVKSASPAERIRAADTLISYLITKFTKDGIDVPKEQLENAIDCLAHYNPEELASIFRIMQKEHQDIFVAWKSVSQKCRKFLSSFVMKHLTHLDKIQ